ncbi:uncharacterized protein LODBEIA_P37090 [Lodderomyces beijingensis]|uniref:Uncharacterized protein n=1 Tax=Lodderomyces beijingensis TaxID=1775926 RepID=A0ABP0ZQL5_9ASCO
MFSRVSKRVLSKRFQHSTAAHAAPKETHPFANRYNFNLDPPPVHEYWNIYNSSILFAFVPVFLGVAYLAKDIGVNLESQAGLLQYANGDNSPLKSIKFGEPQEIKQASD